MKAEWTSHRLSSFPLHYSQFIQPPRRLSGALKINLSKNLLPAYPMLR
jgi:hypothetical protein